MLKGFKKFFALSGKEKRTLLRALVAIPLVSVGLRVWGLERVEGFLERRVRRARKRFVEKPADAIREARADAGWVRAAGRRGVWRPDCLQRSVVLSYLLQRKGIDTEMRFGCRKEDGVLRFHAWLEYKGQVVNDSGDVGEVYQPFPRPMLSPRSHFD